MTQKQKDFVEAIADELDITLPYGWEGWSNGEASEFINDNQYEYYESKKFH